MDGGLFSAWRVSALSGQVDAGTAKTASGCCFHCEAPIPTGSQWTAKVAGQVQPMCCPACAAIAGTIEAAGMAGYYRARQAPGLRPGAHDTTAGAAHAIVEGAALAPLDPAAAAAHRAAADPASGAPQLAPGLFDDPDFQQGFVAGTGDSADRQAHLLLQGIRCGACAWLIERHLQMQPGVLQVRINLLAARMVLRWDPHIVQLSALICALRAVGYDAQPWMHGVQGQRDAARSRAEAAELVVAGLGMMQVMMYALPLYLATPGDITQAQIRLMQWASLVLTLPVVLFSARSLFRTAWRGLRSGHLNMDLPVSLGVLAAFLGSLLSLARGQGDVWFDSLTMFVFLLLGARWLEARVRRRAESQMHLLGRPLPAQALRLAAGDGAGETCSVAGLRVGDRIRVAIGEAIPVDGLVLAGQGVVEEALLTGESLAVWRKPGDKVLAASLNLSEPLDVEVTAVGAGSVLAGILRQMDEALGARAPVAQLADRAAAVFVGGLLLVCLLSTAWWWWHDASRALPVAIAILVVSCPCALALAVPATLAASSARLTRRGLLILRGHTLETLARVRTVVFDKTGTLTEGRPEVCPDWLDSAWAGDPGLRDRRRAALAGIALRLEQGQSHPLASALCRHLHAAFPQAATAVLEQVESSRGAGVTGRLAGQVWRIGRPAHALPGAQHPPSADGSRSAEGAGHADAGDRGGVQRDGVSGDAEDRAGDSMIVLSCDGVMQARFFLRDRLRPHSEALLAALRAAGLHIAILSGDHPAAVAAVAGRLQVRDARGGLTPAGKRAAIRTLRGRGPLLMVGDGLNDAPGLGAADLAIVMGQAPEALARGADALIPAADPATLRLAWCEARCAMSRMRQNLLWAGLYNLLAIPLAACGVLSPWQAGLGMSLSSLLVVGNAIRPGKA